MEIDLDTHKCSLYMKGSNRYRECTLHNVRYQAAEQSATGLTSINKLPYVTNSVVTVALSPFWKHSFPFFFSSNEISGLTYASLSLSFISFWTCKHSDVLSVERDVWIYQCYTSSQLNSSNSAFGWILGHSSWILCLPHQCVQHLRCYCSFLPYLLYFLHNFLLPVFREGLVVCCQCIFILPFLCVCVAHASKGPAAYSTNITSSSAFDSNAFSSWSNYGLQHECNTVTVLQHDCRTVTVLQPGFRF